MAKMDLNLLLFTFVLIQSGFGCPYEGNIAAKDRNIDGYLNKVEACEIQIQPRISGNAKMDQCFDQFESMDLNKNQLISCQEITVAILIGEYLKNQVDHLGAQIRGLYAKKPENCKKVFRRNNLDIF